jgi:hypothetical protein
MPNDYKPWKNYGDKSHSGHPGHSPDHGDGSHDSERESLHDEPKDKVDVILEKDVLSKHDIRLLQNAKNNGHHVNVHYDETKAIEKEQENQAIAWLSKSAQQEVMGYREKNIVENYSKITLRDFHDNNNAMKGQQSDFVPVWMVHGDGDEMSYYQDKHGRISISG